MIRRSTVPRTILFFFPVAFIEAAALSSIVLKYACDPTTTRSYLTTAVCVIFCFCFVLFCFFGDASFSEYFSPYCRSVNAEYVVRFSFRVMFFYLVATGWILTSAYLRTQQIKTDISV